MRKAEEAPVNKDFPKHETGKHCAKCNHELETAVVMIGDDNAKTYMRGFKCPKCKECYSKE